MTNDHIDLFQREKYFFFSNHDFIKKSVILKSRENSTRVEEENLKKISYHRPF